ncbi:hypothetical protein M422DRAFT_260262 [Sphaerobolus stellatus SS14]|uniref:Unplaced genomic scaffold SPHSTscaffold_95, whole genome shotgun sequence n=1 Tax=Sphaerobolus stellatus (strain SS14) TaxID=990650 RepID=A0A0C9URA5_SPHS4|nr:hypothetical protein M422DRAFT_260262 [Sphaerobolus stellatus SS14]
MIPSSDLEEYDMVDGSPYGIGLDMYEEDHNCTGNGGISQEWSQTFGQCSQNSHKRRNLNLPSMTDEGCSPAISVSDFGGPSDASSSVATNRSYYSPDASLRVRNIFTDFDPNNALMYSSPLSALSHEAGYYSAPEDSHVPPFQPGTTWQSPSPLFHTATPLPLSPSTFVQGCSSEFQRPHSAPTTDGHRQDGMEPLAAYRQGTGLQHHLTHNIQGEPFERSIQERQQPICNISTTMRHRSESSKTTRTTPKGPYPLPTSTLVKERHTKNVYPEIPSKGPILSNNYGQRLVGFNQLQFDTTYASLFDRTPSPLSTDVPVIPLKHQETSSTRLPHTAPSASTFRQSSRGFNSYPSIQERNYFQLEQGTMAAKYKHSSKRLYAPVCPPGMVLNPIPLLTWRPMNLKLMVSQPSNIYFHSRDIETGEISPGAHISAYFDEQNRILPELVGDCENPVPEGERQGFTIKFLWPGYKEFAKKISLHHHLGKSSRKDTLKQVFNCVRDFYDKAEYNGQPGHEQWRLKRPKNEEGIPFENLRIFSLHQMTKGSWNIKLGAVFPV